MIYMRSSAFLFVGLKPLRTRRHLMAETLAGNTKNFALRSVTCKCSTLDRIQRLFGTDLSVFVFLFLVLGLKLQSKLLALPPLSSRQLLACHDRPVLDEDVLSTLFRRDLLINGEELVGERCRAQVSFGDLSIGIALGFFVVRNVAESSVQPVVAVRLDESAPTETKPKVVRLDLLRHLFRPNEVEKRGVESLGGELHELASELSCGFPAFAMRLGKVAADEAAATVSMESRAADDGVGWEIEARSVIIATGES
jgi:hypothetical protein